MDKGRLSSKNETGWGYWYSRYSIQNSWAPIVIGLASASTWLTPNSESRCTGVIKMYPLMRIEHIRKMDDTW